MPPKFSLQPVLDVRHSRVEALEIRLAQALLVQHQAQALLETLQENHARVLAALRREQAGRLDMPAVIRLRDNLASLEIHITQQEQVLAAAMVEVQARRQALVAAKQDEETLEVLKEKEAVRFRQRLARLENRLYDDIYIAQAHRRAQQVGAR